MSEFDLINQFFKASYIKRNDVLLGIGDDCAILSPPPDKSLAVSTDTLISGVHFPQSTNAEDIGYKSLAVNLSDLAAMGAEPAWVSLAISMPDANKIWLNDFMLGFNELLDQYNVALIGGDTTHGALSITVNITGFVSFKKMLKRSNARAGDAIFVTNTIGDACIGLEIALNNQMPIELSDTDTDYFVDCLNRPQPQIKAGQLLTRFSVAAIDVSDGLIADLSHICNASNVGAHLKLEKIPLSDALTSYYNDKPDWQKILSAGDDYQLCFTCPPEQVDEMSQLMHQQKIPITCIGEIIDSVGVSFSLGSESIVITPSGYNHF